MGTPYREILENTKTAIEDGFENLKVSIGPKHLATSFPCCMVSVGPASETPVSIGGRKERKVPVTIEVLVREYSSREDGYLQLADIVGHLEEMARQPTFMTGFTSKLTETQFNGMPFYHENQFIHSASIGLTVDLCL